VKSTRNEEYKGEDRQGELQTSRFGNPGNGMPCNAMYHRRGADPPKNESGRNGAVSERDWSIRPVSSGNGTCIAAQTFSLSVCEVVKHVRSIWRMRLLCSSKATALSTDVSETLSRMRRGNAGQISRVFLADILVLQ